MLAFVRPLLIINAVALGSCGDDTRNDPGSRPAPRIAESSDCMDLARQPTVTVSGLLTVQLFAGPPNYESVAAGDAEERALILELPNRVCADDGEFITADRPFDRVHISSGVPSVLGALNAAVGRRVTVRGGAFGAHTGHHRAPLVLFADQVTVS